MGVIWEIVLAGGAGVALMAGTTVFVAVLYSCDESSSRIIDAEAY